jgi:predicted ATP-binding protein involved in virulence
VNFFELWIKNVKKHEKWNYGEIKKRIEVEAFGFLNKALPYLITRTLERLNGTGLTKIQSDEVVYGFLSEYISSEKYPISITKDSKISEKPFVLSLNEVMNSRNKTTIITNQINETANFNDLTTELLTLNITKTEEIYIVTYYLSHSNWKSYFSVIDTVFLALGYSVSKAVFNKSPSNNYFSIDTIASSIKSRKRITLKHNFVNIKGADLDGNKKSLKTISSLQIQEFKGLETFSLNFHPQVNIFLGKNATGKTSILQALALAIIPDDNKDKRDDFEDFIRFESEFSDITLNREDEDAHSVLLTETKKTSQESSYSEEPFFLGYHSTLHSGEIDYANRSREMIEGTERWYFSHSLFKESSNYFADPLSLLYNLNEYLGNEKYASQKEELKEMIQFIIESLNKFIGEDFEIRKDVTSYHFYTKDNNQLKTNQLSEGYRTTIVLLTDIISRIISFRKQIVELVGEEKMSIAEIFANAKGVIAIDEFDRHLHPSWQKVFVNNLKDFLPKVQFFLTTHNPMAVLDRAEGEVQKLVVNENGILEAQKEGATENMDVVQTLLEYFEIDSVVSSTLQNKIDKYYKALASGESKESLESLKKEIKSAHVGINIHDKKYLDYLQFMLEKGIDPFSTAEAPEKLTDTQKEELAKLLF